LPNATPEMVPDVVEEDKEAGEGLPLSTRRSLLPPSSRRL